MVPQLKLPKTSKKRYALIKKSDRKLFHLFALCPDVYKIYQEKVIGIIDMVDALEYHFQRHNSFEKRLNENNGLSVDYSRASHEAVAYLNRLGQLRKLFTSKWFQGTDKKERDEMGQIIVSKIPTVLALMPIRNKYAAHRQHDDPHKDDCESLGFNYHKLQPGKIGKLGSSFVQICYFFPTKQRDALLKDKPKCEGVEFWGESGRDNVIQNNVIRFIPSDVHPIIIKEIFALLEYFMSTKP